MTLQPYDPDKLDQVALRLMDLASMFREMSRICHDCEIEELSLHDKKALEWCENLERWTRKARAEIEMQAIDYRSQRPASPRPRQGR